eukprot:4371463-Pyramimonas_sp.AAC.1
MEGRGQDTDNTKRTMITPGNSTTMENGNDQSNNDEEKENNQHTKRRRGAVANATERGRSREVTTVCIIGEA